MIGIYKITNTLNNKVYIGQSIDIESRWKQHLREAVYPRKNTKLYRAINKYGADNFNFEIIEECELDQSILDERERYWIKYYNSYENGYNSTRGGQEEGSWIINPKEIQQLWDEGYATSEIASILGCGTSLVQMRLTGYKDYNCGTSHSRGLKRSKKVRSGDRYFSDLQSLYFADSIPVHQYTLLGEYVASYKSIAEAVRTNGWKDGTNIEQCFRGRKQRTAHGYQWSKEKVDSMSPVPTPNGKLIKCKETGEIFTSAIEAAKWANIKSKSNIGECCRGVRKSAGKHPETGEKLHWEYID